MLEIGRLGCVITQSLFAFFGQAIAGFYLRYAGLHVVIVFLHLHLL